MQERCEATTIANVRRSESADRIVRRDLPPDYRRLSVRSALSDPIEESCKGNLDFNAFLKLDKICKDCFNLFKDPEVYHLCRSDCFGTGFFNECMETILLKSELKSELTNLLD